MNPISPDEFPNRAFQLAYFLHRERKTALEIATRALNKLQLAATAQGKRLYYRLTGRADARKARSKVSMGEPHLLQRLVYVESEEYERRKEAAAQNPQTNNGAIPARQSDLVVFFIKHLVRITTRRNSFYVTLGLSRLLYNYTTPETMELYNLVIQDPDRVHDDYYYRSRKGLLLKELKERFGALVEIAKGTRGEQRWRVNEESLRQASLVRECLAWFTPWATPCAVPERFDPLSDTIDKLNFQGRHPDEEHEVEVNRIHAALHPDCFARLAAANRLTPPDERLELPQFFLAHNADDDDHTSRMPPNLSADELQTINHLLAQEASRRKAVSSGFLRVLVDGTEVASIDVAHPAVAQFAVDEHAELIEVYGADRSGALLMATHLLDFNGSKPRNFSVTVEGGQKISFTVNVLRDQDGSAASARVAVGLEGTPAMRGAWSLTRGLWNSVLGLAPGSAPRMHWWKPVAAFAALLLVSTGAWLAWTNRTGQRNVVKVTPAPAPTVAIPAPASPQTVQPEQLAVVSPGNRSPKASEVTPTPPMVPNSRDETYVARTFVPNTSTENNPGEVGTRGWNPEVMGKSLAEVRQVNVQIASGNALNDGLGTELRARLTESGALRLSNLDAADAALKISVRNSGEARVIVLVRAVNANGYVVWPAGRRGGSWRYVGRPGPVGARIVSDFANDIERAKR